MSHLSSLHDQSTGSDPSYSPQPSTSSAPRGRGRARARGGRARGAARGRGRGTRGQGRGASRTATGERLQDEDIQRMENLQAQRIADEQARIERLSLEESHQVLQICLTRDPSLLFDVLQISASGDAPPPGPPAPHLPTWCVCRKCREMPTDLEKKCCRQQPVSCISMLPHMEVYILQEGVLRLARRIWNDVRAEEDLPDPGESNKQFRYAAYRQYVVWQYGALGAGHRVVIPSCCVWKIRDRYPDPNGQYKGFVPSRV